MTGYNPDFDWTAESESVAQQSVERVAIYSNPHGDCVIRQEQAWDEEKDTFIVIARAHALTAAYAILEAAGHGDICFHRACGGGFEDVDVPIRPGIAALMAVNEEGSDESEDRTAAERQKRYREKHRNGNDRDVTAPTVTRNGELHLVNGLITRRSLRADVRLPRGSAPSSGLCRGCSGESPDRRHVEVQMPTFAMNAQVGFATVPAAPLRRE